MIVLKHVGKRVSDRNILSDINLTIGKGLTFIVGSSGAGKSTLLHFIGKLDNGDGEIELCFHDKTQCISELDHYCRDYVGFVFQEYNLISGLTVYQNLQIAADLAGIAADKETMDHLLGQFGIPEAADDKIDTLSGGEKQRVSIVRALLKKSAILLADEPTGSLDRENEQLVFETLKKLSRDRYIVVVSHNEEMAEKYADQIIRMKNGRIIRCTGNNCGGYIEERIPEKKTGISFRDVCWLTFHNIIRYKSKFFATVMAMAAAVALLGICLFMNQTVQGQMEQMNAVYYDADLVTVYATDQTKNSVESIVMAGEGSSLSEKTIKDLRSDGLFREVVPCIRGYFYEEEQGLEIQMKQIELDDFFRSRIMTDDIEGKFPGNANEIILSEPLADILYGGDCIGELFSMTDDYGASYQYTISGINHAANVDGVYYTYVPVDSLYDTQRKNVGAYIYLAENVEDTEKTVYAEDANGFFREKSIENILYGDEPKQIGELLISLECARYLYFSIAGEYYDFTTEKIVQNDLECMERLREICGRSWYTGVNQLYSCSVVGVHDGDSDSVCVSEGWLKELTSPVPQYAECYLTDMNYIDLFKDSEINRTYYCESNYENRFSQVIQNSAVWRMFFLIIAIIAFAMGVALIGSFDRISFAERKKEIGILKSLGAGKRELKKLFVFDHLMTGGCFGGFAVVIYSVVTAVISRRYNLTIAMSVHLRIVLGIVLFALIVSLIVCGRTVRNAHKINIVDALRSSF